MGDQHPTWPAQAAQAAQPGLPGLPGLPDLPGLPTHPALHTSITIFERPSTWPSWGISSRLTSLSVPSEPAEPPEPSQQLPSRGRHIQIPRTRTFETMFPDVESAIEAVRDQQRHLGHAICKSHTRRTNGELHQASLACTRGGVHQPRANKRRSNTSSRKCDCPCRWIVSPAPAGYKVEVVNETHNHEGADYARDSAPLRRLTQRLVPRDQLLQRVMALSASGKLTSNLIALQLQEDFPGLLIKGSEVRHLRMVATKAASRENST